MLELLLLLKPLGFGVVQVVGPMGYQLTSIRVATTAEMGPLTHCHLDLASLSLTIVLIQALLILCCVASLFLFHSSVHDFTCWVGMRTLGSAESVVKRPFLKTHRSTEDAHVPAAISPVALAVLVLALSMLEGAIPTAVKP